MKAIIVGSRERYEKFYPGTAFADSVDKAYVDIGTPIDEFPEEAFDADFMAADAVADISERLIARMPNLKIIHSEGVGYNNIDCKAAADRGIYVCNNRGINAGAVAEQTVLLILGLLRQVIVGNRKVLDGRQIEKKEEMMISGITEIGDCRIGLVGFGDIAKAVAKYLSFWGCDIYYNATKRKPKETEQEYNVTWCELPEMLERCDIISIHVPVTDKTREMVDENFLKEMKNDAYLINTARGEIVDNDALYSALSEGWIAGAGLDTIAPEPVPPEHPLLHLPEHVKEKLLLSPHIGGVTRSTFMRGHKNIWLAFEKVANGQKPDNTVNFI